MRWLLFLLFAMLLSACHPAGLPEARVKSFQLTLPGEAPPCDPLSFGTYNLHESRRVQELRKDLLESPAAAWALQELLCDPANPEDSLRQILPPGGWHAVVVPLNRLKAGWESQAIVSRWPIRSVELWPLPASGAKQRVAIMAVLETPAGIVHFINTDHEIGFFSFNRIGDRQMEELLKRLKSLDAERVILAGDFNTTGHLWSLQSNHGAVTQLNARMTQLGLRLLPNRDTGDATYGDSFGLRQLDHVFYRGLRCTGWSSRAWHGSDHRPIVARFAPITSAATGTSGTASPAAP